jgi:hypothetical protein
MLESGVPPHFEPIAQPNATLASKATPPAF